MKKILLLVCLVVPLIGVKAQTYQRKVQQPAFFMPKSALTARQPEQLPAVDSMNYQGRRAPSLKKAVVTPEQNPQPEQNIVSEAPLKTQAPIEEKAPTPLVQEKAPEIPVVAENNEAKISYKDRIKNKQADDAEDYQNIFAEILRQHKEDLNKISKNESYDNPDITAMLEAYKSGPQKITETIYPRNVKF